jgi:ubiquinone/menaquinone biosynthesis C-methylase UbiE/N-acyl-L-homoserine lactone synthetase
MSRFWNFYAQCYDALRVLLPYQELLQKTVRAVLAHRGEKISVLDAGCGTGNFPVTLAESKGEREVETLEIDASTAMLQRANKKTCKLPWVRLREMNLDNPIPRESSSFDCVVFLNALYALKDPEKTLTELHRLLKFGGTLVLANPRKNPKVSDAFKAHFRDLFTKHLTLRNLARTALYLPAFLLVAILNRFFIKKQAIRKRYHFLETEELVQLVKTQGFRVYTTELLYGGTDVFLIASKVLVHSTTKDADTITTEIVSRPEDLDAIYQVRHQVYCIEEGYLDPNDYSDQKESDIWDQHSVQIALRKNDRVIGTFRLIRDSVDDFLFAKTFAIPAHLDRSRLVDGSRMCVLKGERGKRMLLALIAASDTWCEEHGVTHWCFSAPRRLVDFYYSIGWQIQELSGSVEYHHTTVVPCIRTLKNKPCSL